LLKFSDYLEQRIQTLMLEKGMDRHDYLTECEKIDGEAVVAVRFKQKVLKWLLREVPAGLSVKIGYYVDERLPAGPVSFGLWYQHVPKLGTPKGYT
jgi:hypothetical protein